ncbi:uncharacterized protein [Haliotis cracherodii]|uniref:uncharacterized protein n=1 Tax=Haliotis cracherodii TaxID=6455 RepID=UPI0039ECF60B
MQCRLVTLLSVIFLCLRSYVVYCSCTYKEHWIRGSYQIPTMDNPYSKILSGLTLYECLATCFVNTESCRSFNYWANSSVCEFFAISLNDNDNEEEGASVHSIYTDMATMPPDMPDLVGGCTSLTCSGSCYLDRNHRPRCNRPAQVGELDV